MPVYMIRAGETGPVKIGYSVYPWGRLAELQVAHYETLRIVRLFEGGEPEEASLHIRFADLYLRGEWHSFSRLMMGDVGLVEIKPEAIPELPPAPSLDLGPRIASARKRARLSQRDVAALMGVSASAVAQWELFGKTPRASKMGALAECLGVTIGWLYGEGAAA